MINKKDETTGAIQDISASSQEIAASTEEQIASIEEIAKHVENLNGLSYQLQNVIDQFIL